jgi:alpha-glucosidase
VADWFVDRLRKLQEETGIDSYKFDAGELSWSPSDPIFANYNLRPQGIVTDYVTAVAQFGDLVEVRSAYKSQKLPIFLRMIDKDSEWTWNNGLPTLVTTLLQLNMVGYPLGKNFFLNVVIFLLTWTVFLSQYYRI